ncbi:MAG TPA: hypothetical protein PLB91_01080 [Spirochaetales bacterium]|nr:hypothetical protein [Spirochaetales bacterium]
MKLKELFHCHAYIHDLRRELLTLQRALDSASNYATLLETIKKDKEKRIACLNEDVAALSSEIAARRLCYGKDKETLIVENLNLRRENETLRGHLNGRHEL